MGEHFEDSDCSWFVLLIDIFHGTLFNICYILYIVTVQSRVFPKGHRHVFLTSSLNKRKFSTEGKFTRNCTATRKRIVMLRQTTTLRFYVLRWFMENDTVRPAPTRFIIAPCKRRIFSLFLPHLRHFDFLKRKTTWY